MKYIKLFENYEESINKRHIMRICGNESINSYAIWIPEMYKYWWSFQQDFINNLDKLAFVEQLTKGEWGFGRDAKKLREYIRKYRDPNKLVEYFDERNKRKEEIREILKDRYDDIFKGGASREESKLMEEQRLIQDELSDLHWIWTTCFKDHNFEVFYDVLELVNDFADDENMVPYLAYVELFRGLQLKIIFANENEEIKPRIDYSAIETGGFISSDDPIYERAKLFEKRMEYYFMTVSMRSYGSKFILTLTNQKD